MVQKSGFNLTLMIVDYKQSYLLNVYLQIYQITNDHA